MPNWEMLIEPEWSGNLVEAEWTKSSGSQVMFKPSSVESIAICTKH